MSGVFTSFGKLLLKSGTIEGEKNFDCGFEKFLLYRGLILNCKKRGF